MVGFFPEGWKRLQVFCFLAGVPFLIYSIVSFKRISEWGDEWVRKKTLVDSGAVAPLTATVARKFEDEDSRGRKELKLDLRIPGRQDRYRLEVLNRQVWNGFGKG